MKLPTEIAERIRRTMDEMSPEGGHIDAEACRHGGIALMGTIGSLWLLRPDGTLWDVDEDSGKPLEPLAPELHIAAIAAGTERYPWLAVLLPLRPPSAQDCAMCRGAGNVGGMLCPTCDCLGWVRGSDGPPPDDAMSAPPTIDELARCLVLGSLLARIRSAWGPYELVDHWQQGEFHHDVVLRVPGANGDLGGTVLVVATNCNGGVKEVLCFSELPTRAALWHSRCPDVPDFEGMLPELMGQARTDHWFDPCELLRPDARSEYRAEFRERQPGGGWVARKVESKLRRRR